MRHGRSLSRRLSLAIALAGCLALSACHSVTGVSPSPAGPGQAITITGSGFGASQGASQVRYDGAALAVTSWTNTQIVATLPAVKATGTYDVVVALGSDVSTPVPHVFVNPGDVAIFGATFTPNPKNVLSGTITFQTTVPATPTVEVLDPEGTWTVPASGTRSTVPGTSHEVVVVGLRSNVTFPFRLSATDGATSFVNQTLSYRPGAIPFGISIPITVQTSQPANMQPGLTLFSMGRGPLLLTTADFFAVDNQGRVVWYCDDTVFVTDFHKGDNGNFYAVRNRGESIRELDLMCNTVDEWSVTSLGVDRTHHAVDELPNGNLMTFGTELRFIPGFPGGQTLPIVMDTIVEFTKAGVVVSELSLHDILDPYRITAQESFDSNIYDGIYGPIGTKDATHGNALQYVPADDSVIVSLRHQDAVMKISRVTGQLVWVIGEDLPTTSGDDAWPFLALTGGGELPKHQHGAHLLPNGRVILYDNGNFKPVEYSRAVEFALNVPGLTMTQSFEWFDPTASPLIFADFVGDVRDLPNGNVLVGDLGITDDAVSAFRYARIAEVRRSDGAKVFEMTVRDPNNTLSYSGFNLDRISSLYP